MRSLRAAVLFVVAALIASSCTTSASSSESITDSAEATVAAPATSTPEPTDVAPSTEVAEEAAGDTAESTAEAAPEPTAKPTEDAPALPMPDFSFNWEPCGPIECASFAVPVSYADPLGPTVNIDVARRQASNPDIKIGSLLVNFGGPGGEGTPGLDGFVFSLPISVQERFDVVSWNPRGTGEETGLSCPTRNAESVLYDEEDGFEDDVAVEQDRRTDFASCTDVVGLLDNIGTVPTVHDMDAIRQGLGEEQISYLGFSYGTELGWLYATLFPERVRAMVLDAPVTPGQHGPEGWLAQLENFDAQLARVDRLCDEAATCAVSGEGLTETLERLRQELRAEPQVTVDGSPFTESDLLDATITSLYLSPVDIAERFASALKRLDDGDTAVIELFNPGDFSYDAYRSVTCADGAGINTAEELEAYIAARFDRGATFAASPDVVLCDEWPAAVQPLPELNTTGAGPILVVATTNDPATPYAGGIKLADAIDEGILVTFDGGGHGAVTSNVCIDNIFAAYMVSLTVPAEGTECYEAQGILGIGFDGDGDDGPGVPVISVSSGSAAEQNGIAPGDVLLRVGDNDIEGFSDLPRIVPGVPTKVIIERDGEQQSLELIPQGSDWT